MANDTQNALTDFDLCLALSQRAINSQMEDAWKAWKRRKQFKDTISIFKIKNKDGKVVDSKYGLQAKIAPLEISLNVDNAKLGQVKVTLHLQSGQVVYFDEESEEKAELPIENWSISFITDLEKKPVDIDALAKIDPDVHHTAKEAIEKSGLPDSVFSIEYLFLKFTKVELLLSDNKNIQIPESVPAAARNKALSCLNFFLQGELGEFMLGTVVRRNNKQATPTFALTDFIFHVQSNKDKADASTLSYLGMLANEPMPQDQNAARISLKDTWVRPEMIDGTAGLVSGVMAISKKVFMDKYLIPMIQNRLEGTVLEANNLSWTFKYEPPVQKWQEPWPPYTAPTLHCNYEKALSYWLTLDIIPGTSEIKLFAEIKSHAFYDGYDIFDLNKLSWVHRGGFQQLEGSLELISQGINTDFKIDSQLNYSFHPVCVNDASTEGLAKVSNFFEGVFKTLNLIGETYEEQVQNQQTDLLKQLKSLLDEELNQLRTDISQHAFIPPGGGVFTFQNLRFSKAGDLIFDAIYQAP